MAQRYLYNLNINLKAVIDNGLQGEVKLNHLAVFEVIKNMISNWREINKLNDMNGDWYNISYQKIIDELPILDIKTTMGIRKLIQKLSELGILELNPNNQTLGRTYMRLGINASKLFYFEDSSNQDSVYHSKQKFIGGINKSLEGGINKSLDNNNTNIINTNNNIKIQSNKFDAEIYISSLNISDELKEALKSLLEIRKIKKTVTTKTVIDIILKNLIKWYGKNIEKQIECINQSIINGWGGVFEMKQSTKTPYQSNLTNEQYYNQKDYNSETTQEPQERVSSVVRENPLVYTEKQWNELVVRCEGEKKELIFDPGEMRLAKQKWSREK